MDNGKLTTAQFEEFSRLVSEVMQMPPGTIEHYGTDFFISHVAGAECEICDEWAAAREQAHREEQEQQE